MRRRHSRPPARTPSGLVFGTHPALEMLRASPEAVVAVCVVPGARAAARVAAAARALGVTVEETDHAALDRLTSGAHHQGVAVRTCPFAYATLDQLLERRAACLVALDGITDPHNLGSVIRSAEVLGAGGLILPLDRSAAVTASVTRASSGAIAHLPIAQVVNLVRALRDAKQQGYWAVGLDPAGSSTFQELPPFERVVLVVGGEGAGLRPLVREACDFMVRIPGRGRVVSLNAAVAAAIGLYALGERQPRT
jgi:23S rRNA (guanosine2251-2'-O)-methyltransferase